MQTTEDILDADGRRVIQRIDIDARTGPELFFTKARRAYWLTILGPDLASAAGGVEAARTTGARGSSNAATA
jgi:hypothetical protein